jgi:hypothetical protein
VGDSITNIISGAVNYILDRKVFLFSSLLEATRSDFHKFRDEFQELRKDMQQMVDANESHFADALLRVSSQCSIETTTQRNELELHKCELSKMQAHVMEKRAQLELLRSSLIVLGSFAGQRSLVGDLIGDSPVQHLK